MFNVLPDIFKKKIIGQYQKRKIIVWLLAVLCLQVSLLIFILPAYIYLRSTDTALQAQNNSLAHDTGTESNADIAEIFHSTNNKLSALTTVSSSNNLDFLLTRMVSLKSSNIHLNEIIYTTHTASSSSFSLRGTAKNRDSLLSFSKNLEADSVFENVDLPVSNFAKDTNIDFSMSVDAKN